ncbi:homeobox domain-containing protein [Phthorimaea operculella]|nr:homeobox domain-containing protein [Phthorimaea operculella]
MDVSPVQSGSKCSSDFSIERILSDRATVRGSSAETPSWLCCTRYQPPRIPRISSGNACRPRRSGRHARVPFTAAQAAALEAAYSRAPYLAPPALRALAAALQLRDDRIKIWFQNRRARERREKCANIAPPQAVTLPPTTSQATIMSTRSWTSKGNLQSTQCALQLTSEGSGTIASIQSAQYALEGSGRNKSLESTQSPLQLTSQGSRNGSFSAESDDDKETERPDTPLDVETVE